MKNDPLTPRGNKPMVTPIVHSVNYEYIDFETLRKITDDEVEGYTYHRDNNPTIKTVERKITRLENAEDTILCTTGMAACTLVYFTYLKAGDNLILFHDIYGANYKVSLILERMGIDVTWLDANDSGKIEEHIRENTRMILLESPSNPLCKVIDIAMIRKAADRVGAMVIVDNTFATPFHQKPLELGAHLVVHSATKALGGHNDIMAGCICGSKEDYDKLWFTRQAIGTTLDAFSASLLERGLKTFEMRSQKMSDNALAMAAFLEKHSKISNMSYPGLKSHPGHEIAQRQMSGGYSGMLAFDVGDKIEDARKFIAALETIVHAVSLGATESLVCIPYLTTMLYLPPERRLTFGVNKNTVRLSAGIENPDILLQDIEQALEKV